MKTVLVICGTRPEAIKLAPVVRELRRRDGARSLLCVTAQHRRMLDSVLQTFHLAPDIDLDLMRPDQHPSELLARMLPRLTAVLHQVRPDTVLVQGDTTTVLAASMAAFLDRIPLGHVEAGLRTHDLAAPFPEEMNRRVAGVTASWHFAPTPAARDNLVAELTNPTTVFVTGNTVIDALRWVQSQLSPADLPEFVEPGRRLVLVTAHRRENFGDPLRRVCGVLRRLAEEFPDIQIIYPTHLNPEVQRTVQDVLGSCRRVRLTEPVDYRGFVSLMAHAALILTDSGGVQEEAPALGKPVLVLRERSERTEAVGAGTVRLVGTDPARILAEARAVLADPAAPRPAARPVNLHGDGLASRRIVDLVLDGRSSVPEFVPEA